MLMAAKGMDERCRASACGLREEDIVRLRMGQREQRRGLVAKRTTSGLRSRALARR
jgi:hypothetical protein